MTTFTFPGIRVAFPAICRTLEPAEVVERTVRAMAEKQFLVILPKVFYAALFLKRSVATGFWGGGGRGALLLPPPPPPPPPGF